MNKIIEVSGLKKSYGNVNAVKGIDFYVEKGSMFAFLGVNGAGKSTTIDILSTLLKPDSGKVIINGFSLGKDDDKIRASIGMVFQDSMLDTLLTVEENLLTRGGIYGYKSEKLKSAISSAVQTTGIQEILKRQYGKLSGGQRRRTDIARGLINTPEILILDEPTTGLDPQTRKNIWDTIHTLQKTKGMTVFLTTHYMEEAAQADYIAIIGKGKIKAAGTPLSLKEKYCRDSLRIKPKNAELLKSNLQVQGIACKINKEVFHFDLKSTLDSLPIIELCKDNIDNVEVLNGTMDDVFINVTNGGEVESCLHL